MHKKSVNGNYKSPVEEVCQQLMSLLAENTLRVELYPFEIPLPMANGHNLPAVAAGRHLKTFGKRRGINQQRVVASDGQRIIQPLKDPLPVMMDGEVLPCITFAARTIVAPKTWAIA